MTVWEWTLTGLACLAVVVGWLFAEHLGNRWWQALPGPIREKGLIRWFFMRKQAAPGAPPPDTPHPTPPSTAPSALARTLCTLCAAFIAALGLLAIGTETHSGYARFQGHVTLVGDQAVSMGLVILCIALLPLVVWVPRRWLVRSLLAWWVLLMATIFQAVFKPF